MNCRCGQAVGRRGVVSQGVAGRSADSHVGQTMREGCASDWYHRETRRLHPGIIRWYRFQFYLLYSSRRLSCFTLLLLLLWAQASDQEVAVLALATLANICSYSDTLLLSDTVVIEAIGSSIPLLIDTLKDSQQQQKPQRIYAAASIANASFHPRLAAQINQHGGTACYAHRLSWYPYLVHSNDDDYVDGGAVSTPGLQLCREVERQSAANLHIFGSKLGECMQTAVYRLSDRREGDPRMGAVKYTYATASAAAAAPATPSFAYYL